MHPAPCSIPWISEFSTHLQAELNRSPLTIKAYLSDICQFAEFITDGSPLEWHPTDISPSDIRTWLAHLGRNGEKATSIRRKTQSLRAYYTFLCRRRIMTGNPAADVTLAKLPRPLPHLVKTAEIEEILDRDVESESISDRLQHLILHLLYATGIRRAELLSLTDSSVNHQRHELRILGKGSKERIIPIAPELASEIEEWQRFRDGLCPEIPEPKPLLVTKKGRLTEYQLRKIVEEILAGTSTDRKSPHTLRHTFATAMLNGGADLDSVRALLGHASVATTQIYTHLSMTDLKREYASAHPRASRENLAEEKGAK